MFFLSLIVKHVIHSFSTICNSHMSHMNFMPKKKVPVLNEIVKHVLVDVLRTTQIRQTLLHLISAAGRCTSTAETNIH